MRGLDYRSVVGQKPDFDAELKAYVLRLGSVELEPISYSTLVTLRDCPDVVRELLDLCFSERPVMWSDLSLMSAEEYGERLSEIEILLAAIDERFENSNRPCHGVLTRIVELWLGHTVGALERLEDEVASESEASTRTLATAYRRTVLPCVKALLELLPEEDQSAIKGRQRFDEARGRLGEVLSAAATLIGSEGWHKGEITRDSEEPGFVTWGIP